MAELCLLTLSLSLLFLSASASASASDLTALLAVKLSVSLDPSGRLSSWDPKADAAHCRWPGVACDPSSGRVIGLDLSATPSSAISGTLASAVGDLTELRYLSLRGNNFSGQIPDEIAALSSLRSLDLSRNSLSGPIPENLVGFSRIESVDLSFNQLTGGISVGLSTSCRFLTHLKLSGNFIVDRIPPEIGKCSNLRSLRLDRNIFEGRIPAEICRISELRILDVSRNSLTERIPSELGKCRKLSVLVLTNPVNGDEFNAFEGAVPLDILSIPSLEILWAPRANIYGELPDYTNSSSCALRVLNLGENYIRGVIPEWLARCQNLTFLDLSSNNLKGSVPSQLGVRCMEYANLSRNSLSGSIFGLSEATCTKNLILGSRESPLLAYSNLIRGSISDDEDDRVILHDFSWNSFSGPLPSFSLPFDNHFSYGLLLSNNAFNGSFSGEFFRPCEVMGGLAVNLSDNLISGEVGVISSCPKLRKFEAANNRLSGWLSIGIGNLTSLLLLDLRGNYITGIIPDQLAGLKDMNQVLLGRNNLSGEIPVEIGGMTSLTILDLSKNSLIGGIPSSLANAVNLEALFLDQNRLSGEIPQSFSTLRKLYKFDVSYNNLSGVIPHLVHSSGCGFFKGNYLLQPCQNANASSLDVIPSQNDWNKLKCITVGSVASASVIVSVLFVLVLVLFCGRRKASRLASLRSKVVVTFTDTPTELNYEKVVKATGNYSIQNLIGTGGFGATYKAEIVPGFSVAVKRLSMGRFQGLQQFDAEIRTLGRIRHKNLVTLIGYHMGESDTFLIYNYLSGGNLESFIRSISSEKIRWSVIHKIALDVAQALSYLHYSCAPRIVHRDIKPSNILLDEKLNAYISDFGLARLLEVSETHATTDVAGTFGYVAPEYATTCRVSDKADVYSFGVVLLELMSGKRSLDPSFSEYGNGFTIVAWGRLLINEGRAHELFPPALWGAGQKGKLVGMLRLAVACTVEALPVRPSMKQVVETLKQLKN